MASRGRLVAVGLVGGLLGMGAALVAPGAVARQQPVVAHDRSTLQAQLHEVEAKTASARTRNRELQAQVAQRERQNDARQKQLQQRDGQIAALRKQLQAAGVAVSAGSAGV